MNRLVTLLCSFGYLVLSATSPVSAEDWPTYRHDATRAGATGETLAWPLTSQWTYRTPVPLRTAWSGAEGRSVEGKDLHDRVRFDDALHVAVVKGRVYFGSSVDHRVPCVDAVTGRTVWTAFTDAPFRLAPTVAEGRVYIGSEDGYAWCLDAPTGHVLWRLRLGPADERIVARGEMISRWPVRTGILVEDGVAYFGAGIFPHENVYLSAVDAKTGKPIWRNDQVSHANAGRADLSPQGYLLATKAALYFPSGRSRPSAVNRKTGKI
ncbi:MAG: PQQ-binding-like beta-propeller repeat protein, partial [Planctomycetales bacterium]|nr:PQQ-binding-like beta-propeller repeat protein [Planctomycetales bacterium]